MILSLLIIAAIPLVLNDENTRQIKDNDDPNVWIQYERSISCPESLKTLMLPILEVPKLQKFLKSVSSLQCPLTINSASPLSSAIFKNLITWETAGDVIIEETNLKTIEFPMLKNIKGRHLRIWKNKQLKEIKWPEKVIIDFTEVQVCENNLNEETMLKLKSLKGYKECEPSESNQKWLIIAAITIGAILAIILIIVAVFYRNSVLQLIYNAPIRLRKAMARDSSSQAAVETVASVSAAPQSFSVESTTISHSQKLSAAHLSLVIPKTTVGKSPQTKRIKDLKNVKPLGSSKHTAGQNVSPYDAASPAQPQPVINASTDPQNVSSGFEATQMAQKKTPQALLPPVDPETIARSSVRLLKTSKGLKKVVVRDGACQSLDTAHSHGSSAHIASKMPVAAEKTPVVPVIILPDSQESHEIRRSHPSEDLSTESEPFGPWAIRVSARPKCLVSFRRACQASEKSVSSADSMGKMAKVLSTEAETSQILTVSAGLNCPPGPSQASSQVFPALNKRRNALISSQIDFNQPSSSASASSRSSIDLSNEPGLSTRITASVPPLIDSETEAEPSSMSSTVVSSSVDPEPVAGSPKRITKVEQLPAYELSSFIELMELASGSFGSCYLYGHPSEGRVVAKLYKENVHKAEKKLQKRELEISVALMGHKNIIAIKGTIFKTDPTDTIGFLMEEMWGDLLDFMSTVNRPELKLLNSFMFQLASGISHMHIRRIIHRDLKPENLLLAHDFRTIKIADFGLARRLPKEGERQTRRLSNLGYAAPELYGSGRYTTSADVYSFGAIVYFLFYGRDPYNEEKFTHGFFSGKTARILEQDWSRPTLKGKSTDGIIAKSWVGNPAARPSMQDILQEIGNPDGRFPRY